MNDNLIIRAIRVCTSPVFQDGLIYFLLAIFAFLQVQFGSDEAGKFIALQPLFWLKTITGAASAGLLALKLFRSRSYADHQDQKEKVASETEKAEITK